MSEAHRSKPPVSDAFGAPAAASFERARVAVLPVPFEATVSYGAGTARGPAAILEASHQVELWDERASREPGRAGVWTSPPLEPDPSDTARAVERVADRFGELLDAGKWVAMLGGEHSVTPGAVAATAARHPGLTVVQLDAHADLREAYGGDPNSHACAMARCLEHAAVRAWGVRSLSAEEARRIERGTDDYAVVYAHHMQAPGAIERLLGGLGDRPVYLTVDVDYFDPSIVPATGTPEPGGGLWYPTQELLDRLFERSHVVACDIVELAPVPGLHHADFAMAKLLFGLIGRFAARDAGA